MTPQICFMTPHARTQAGRTVDALPRDGLMPKLRTLLKPRALLLVVATNEPGTFTPPEHSVPAQTQVMPRIAETHSPADVHEKMRRHVSWNESIAVPIVGGIVDAFARLAIGVRALHPAHVRKAP